MNKLNYIIKLSKKLNYKEMYLIACRIGREENRKAFLIFIDMMYCGIIYGAGYHDYDAFGFINLTKKERKTYLTRGKNNKLVRLCNDRDYCFLYDLKNEFNQLFHDELHRDYFFINHHNQLEFKNWMRNKTEIIVKPNDDACGNGIEKITIDDDIQIDVLYQTLLKRGLTMVEEVIKQHHL